ncbi:MAG TPA: tRNA(Met) cytidine acetyltransferase, partial [Chromatiaceae bacterium]|nr:tRNA(Met) cytidine acetyltransferase [Chromatiaceae bacterium]
MPASRQQRKFLLISGSPSHCHRQALEQVDKSALWIGWKAPHPFQAFEPGRLEQKLGSEVEQLVFDALEGFDPNAFAMALGLVRGGGRFLLLTPPLSDWPSLPDRELARLAVAGWHQVGSSLFLERFAALLMEQPTPTSTASDGQSGTWEALTKDQARALERLEHLARGHPHRPVMITADRGRGKSALFGIFAARLLTEGRRHILVTAPRQSATRILFRHALENLPGARQRQGRVETDGRRLEFMAPDALIEKKPAAELLLIDEAAGIPLPLLEKLILVWPRVALASTVHGYEGSGRGFLLKLGRWMDELRPQWHHIHLQEPVRWASGDRLEAFGRRLLLLDAEPEKI